MDRENVISIKSNIYTTRDVISLLNDKYYGSSSYLLV